MSRWIAVVSLGSMCLALAGCPAEEPEEAADESPAEVQLDSPPEVPDDAVLVRDRQRVIDANTAFALDVYRKQDASGNLIFSPWSLSVALAMTWGGAETDTAAAMAKTLHFDLERDKVLPVFQYILAEQLRTEKAESFELVLANRLWGQKGYGFKKEFLDQTKKRFGARLVEVDFKADAPAAVKRINGWVAKQTKERITDLLKELDEGSRLVLVNAIYFNAEWSWKFKENRTRQDTFHRAPGDDVQVPFMHQTRRIRHADVFSADVVELMYHGRNAMVIVVPKEVDGLAKVVADLTPKKLAGWLSRMETRSVRLALPKFEARTRLELKKTLSDLGMAAAFSNDADFSGMTDKKPGLAIDDVIHQAFVKVDEEGTEAAAATAVVMKTASAPRPDEPVVVRADRPFLFFIRGPNGTVLFLGRLADPKS